MGRSVKPLGDNRNGVAHDDVARLAYSRKAETETSLCEGATWEVKQSLVECRSRARLTVVKKKPQERRKLRAYRYPLIRCNIERDTLQAMGLAVNNRGFSRNSHVSCVTRRGGRYRRRPGRLRCRRLGRCRRRRRHGRPRGRSLAALSRTLPPGSFMGGKKYARYDSQTVGGCVSVVHERAPTKAYKVAVLSPRRWTRCCTAV